MMDSQYSKSDPESLNGATTLMLRHIPNATKARSLIDLMDSMGFKDKIDYLYLPCDTTTMSNKGYAFVNFIDPEDAKKFMVVMQGYALNAYSSKRVELTRADAQGVAANLMRLQSFWTWTGDMMGEWSWPWIRIDGRLVCISAPQAAQLLNLDLTSEQHMRGGSLQNPNRPGSPSAWDGRGKGGKKGDGRGSDWQGLQGGWSEPSWAYGGSLAAPARMLPRPQDWGLQRQASAGHAWMGGQENAWLGYAAKFHFAQKVAT
jgi:hypothetical protein